MSPSDPAAKMMALIFKAKEALLSAWVVSCPDCKRWLLRECHEDAKLILYLSDGFATFGGTL